MSFKQKFICQSGPFPFDFHQERASIFQNINQVIRSCHPNEWNLRSVSPLYYIQSMKQIYGLTSQQLASFINYFLSLLKQPNLEADPMIIIMKSLNTLREYKINIRKLIKTDNEFFFSYLQEMMEKGCKYQIKSADSVVDEFMKTVRHFSECGEDIMEKVLDLAIVKRENKFLALFIRSVKSQKNALMVLEKLFAESSLWERDGCFYYIISEITRKFPNIDYSIYYETLFHETIKIITTIIDPTSEEDIKKLINPEISLNLPPILKCIANILVNLLKPTDEPGWETVWVCIERIFSLISSTLDHSKDVQFMNDFLMFIKQFVKVFTQRYRTQRHMFEIENEDYIEEFNGQPNQKLIINEEYSKLFISLWPQMIPELLYLEDNDIRVAKILYELVLFSTEDFLILILNQIIKFLEKDTTLVSIFSCKMTILLLSEFIIKRNCQEHEMNLLVQCCNSLLEVMEKLGVSQNLDILELVMRCFLHFSEKCLDNILVQNLVEDIINVILNNMDAMSINLEATESQEAQLYIDLRNIYFPFILRLNEQQIKEMSDKMLYKIKNSIPEHRQSYEFLIVALCYVNKSLPKKILDFVFKQIISSDQNNERRNSSNPIISLPYTILPMHSEYFLSLSNEEHLKWYCSITQCAFQYHPNNLVEEWPRLQKIVVSMLRQWEKSNITDWGLDLLFNLLINLCHVHLPAAEFNNPKNFKYQTLEKLDWQETTPEQIALILHIKKVFYDNIEEYMHKKYDEVLKNSEVVKKLRSQKIITVEKPNKLYNIEVSEAENTVVNCLLSSEAIPTLDDLNEKNTIYKLVSIQYTVFSAFQERCPYTLDSSILEPIKPFFITGMPCVRDSTIKYLKFLKQVLCHFKIFADPNLLKTYHFLWREAHDEIFFSSAIVASNQKLQPHFHPHLHKKKQLFSSPFLIISEIYVITMLRIELHCFLRPLAYINDRHYISDMISLTFSGSLDTSFKSPVPSEINAHKECHKKIIDLCRIKFCQESEESYANKYISATDKTDKERYLQSIRNIILGIKRNQVMFTFRCCYRDQSLWAQFLQILEFYPLLQKKGDRSVFVDILYLIIIFTVDPKGFLVYYRDDPVKNSQKLQEIIDFIAILLEKIKEGTTQVMQKNTLVMAVILLCFQEYVPLDQEIHLQVLALSIQMAGKLNEYDQNNIGKTLLYRYINRIIKSKVKKTKIENKPVKRSFDQYLKYRNVGGQTKQGLLPIDSIKTDKVDNYFYPLKQLQKVTVEPLNIQNSLQKMVSQFLCNKNQLTSIYNCFKNDLDLKSDERSEQLSFDIDEPKKVSHNGHKIMNYIFDSNPLKLDIFSSFVDNFISYQTLFYHKLYRKMLLMGNDQTKQIHKKIIMHRYDKCQNEEKKLRQFIMTELLPHLCDDEEFMEFYTNQLTTCSNQQFYRLNNCLVSLFCIDWRLNIRLYPKIVKGLKVAKGRIHLRLLEVLNSFILCTGRFGRDFAVEGIEEMLKGIDQGTDQISELIVSMLISCFIIPINLEILPEWVEEPLEQLVKEKRLSQITETAGYQIDRSLMSFLDKIISECEQEKQLASKNLKTYSKIANKILSSITVYRFNDSFYDLLKTTILYFLNKVPSSLTGMPSADEQNNYDDDIVAQLKDSEYPENIYQDIMKQVLKGMQNDKMSVKKKKLKYLEGITINRCFVTGKISFPPFFGNTCLQINGNGKIDPKEEENQKDKVIYLEHIIAISNIARILKADQLEKEVKCALSQKESINNIYMMMALLLAAGTRQFQWRQELLNEIIQYKKIKVVKDFISYWWKGRSPQTEEQRRLLILVRSVENPYSYFA